MVSLCFREMFLFFVLLQGSIRITIVLTNPVCSVIAKGRSGRRIPLLMRVFCNAPPAISPDWHDFRVHEPILIFDQAQHVCARADRSGEDRYLGMVEAAGSIPARSIVVSIFFKPHHTEHLPFVDIGCSVRALQSISRGALLPATIPPGPPGMRGFRFMSTY
jgi:hypothetical protein